MTRFVGGVAGAGVALDEAPGFRETLQPRPHDAGERTVAEQTRTVARRTRIVGSQAGIVATPGRIAVTRA